jgi:hypothetical protein
MIGETRIQGLMARGASQTLPVGWLMEFMAIGTRPQKADCHDTRVGESIPGYFVSRLNHNQRKISHGRHLGGLRGDRGTNERASTKK